MQPHSPKLLCTHLDHHELYARNSAVHIIAGWARRVCVSGTGTPSESSQSAVSIGAFVHASRHLIWPRQKFDVEAAKMDLKLPDINQSD
jgi:hypothetical protein